MTKIQMIDEFFTITKSDRVKDLEARLEKLYDEKRITAGAWIYIYTESKSFGHQKMMEILDRASKAKSYLGYLDTSVTVRDIEWNLNRYKQDLDRTEAFVTEQESLPFEQTQYQVLDAKGELK